MKIGIINGSVREGAVTKQVADFVAKVAGQRSGEATFELVNLAEFNVPVLSSPVHPMMANKSYDDVNVQKWSDVIDGFDAYVFVTPEYNHGVPGGFKNAVDSLGSEWVGKPVSFVGHGSVGGVRAIEQWRQITANFSMPNTRAELNFNMFVDWKDGEFAPADRHATELNGMFDALEALVVQVKSVANANA